MSTSDSNTAGRLQPLVSRRFEAVSVPMDSVSFHVSVYPASKENPEAGFVAVIDAHSFRFGGTKFFLTTPTGQGSAEQTVFSILTEDILQDLARSISDTSATFRGLTGEGGWILL